MDHPIEAHIRLSALRHNLGVVRQALTGQRIMAIIKADGYGHGLLAVASALYEADALGIARLEEAQKLRAHGIDTDITLLSERLDADGVTYCSNNAVSIVVYDREYAQWLTKLNLPRALSVWLKIDTGMHRLGIRPDEFQACYAQLNEAKNIACVNVMTHFSCADDPQNPSTRQQLDVFNPLVAGIAGNRSLANSAAILAHPESHADWVRPGIMLYGADPLQAPNGLSQQLLPAMNLYARIIALREIDAGETVGYNQRWTAQRRSRIATVSIGYADGYPRHAENGTPVLINGQRAQLAGQVSMDMICVDITDHPTAAIGDIVTLWGEGLAAQEVANHSGTIAYQLFTGIGKRVRLRYLQ